MPSCRVIFTRNALSVYQQLREDAQSSKEARMLLDAIDRKTTLLAADGHLGNPIAKRLFPEQYRHLGISSLFRLELPLFWRLLYTLTRIDESAHALILDVLDHQSYGKLFGYKGKK